LTNATPLTLFGSSCPAIGTSYFRFTVSSNAVRAQFEVLSPSDDVNLVAQKGLPLPTFATAPYQSTNSGTSDELITLFTPPLTPGDWYLGVVHTSANAVSYTVKATEFTDAGTNLIINAFSIVTNSLCITWTNALVGAHYYVQGKVSLSDSNWVAVSPTLTATATSDSYCVPLPTTNQFFRVAQGLSPSSTAAPGGPVPDASRFSISLSVLSNLSTNTYLKWTSAPNSRFVVEWSPTISPPAWSAFTNVVSSTNTAYEFKEDGSQTGGMRSPRFYRARRTQ